jgi:phosphoglycolate phosphatase-like HAD superfamily hydrolase
MRYSKFIFDCDGVILNSNDIKTSSLSKILNNYNSALVDRFYNTFDSKFGHSRHQKLSFFCSNILQLKGYEYENTLSELLNTYSELIISQLLNCEISEVFTEDFKSNLDPHATFVVTAGDEYETKYIFKKRNLEKFFTNENILGSPKTKYQNIDLLISEDKILPKDKVLFIGDSSSDFEVASHFNFDFLFVSDWSENPEWEPHNQNNSPFNRIKSLSDLDKYLESLI